MNNIGSAFEQFVIELYTDRGFLNIKPNLILNDDKTSVRAQIDFSYKSLFRTKYVECKYRDHENVSLEDVAKFSAVMDIFKIHTSAGEIVTNSKFDKRAIVYANEKHIKLVDGECLRSMCGNRFTGIGVFYLCKNCMDTFNKKGAWAIYESFFPKLFSMDKQIRSYLHK
jgi:hypothetical protein